MEDEQDIENVSSLHFTSTGVAAVSSLPIGNASNWTTWMKQEDFLKNSPTIQINICIFYAVIFVVGLLGNILVVFVVLQNRAMQTVTNCFIANLALSDILLCVVAVPFTPLYFFSNEWAFGKIMCHLLAFSQGTSVYVSTLTLTSIAIDRFFVILHPFRPRMKMTTCCITICAIWLVALCATLPYGIFVDIKVVNNNTYCEENWTDDSDRQIYGAVTSVMQFIVPFVIMAYAYTRVWLKLADRSREKAKIRLRSCRGEELDRERKRRTNRMLIAMVAIFGASWMPLNVVNLLNDLYAESTAWWEYYNFCFFLAHTVAMSSTCYNVFLYAWLNDNFRKELKRVLPCFSDGPPTAAASAQHPIVTPGAGPTAAITGTTLATNAASACDLRKRSINGLPTIMDGNQPLLHMGNPKNLTSDAPVRCPGQLDGTSPFPPALMGLSGDVDGSETTFPDQASLDDGADVYVRLTDEALGLTDGVGDKESEPGAAIEMTTLPLAAAMIVGEDTCPQCSSASAKTSFMTFDELADVGAINNRAAANPSSVIGPVNPSV